MPIKQAVNGNFASFVRKNVSPELPGLDKKQAGAVTAAVVKNRTFVHLAGDQAAKKTIFLNRI